MGPTKVLSEKPLCRSLSSIHILYNQAIVGEMGPLLASARWIANVSLPGGSTTNGFSGFSTDYVFIVHEYSS